MIVRTLPWFAALALTVACGAPIERGYYAPVGVDFGDTIASWEAEDSGARIEVRCQGVYRNSVKGHDVRTAHLQMQLARTGPGELEVPLADIKVDFLGPQLVSSRPLPVDEVYSGRERIDDAMVVPQWSRRSFDLFFDSARMLDPVPEVVRLRFRYRAGGEESWVDCQFRRIPEDDPRLPPLDPPSETSFGLRSGYYLVGWDDLGVRALRDSEERREHYLFHDPSDWF